MFGSCAQDGTPLVNISPSSGRGCRAEVEVAFHLLDRRGRASSKEGIFNALEDLPIVFLTF